LLPLFLAVGCGSKEVPAKPVQVEPHVRLVKVERRDISHTVGQPGFIYPYEQTAIYPKVPGFVEKWHVDIGDRIEKDQEIALLFVPELDAELEQKKAQVALDNAQVRVAGQLVDVAVQNEVAAGAHVEEFKANIGKFDAEVDRWESEVKRLTGLTGDGGVINQQIFEEARKSFKSTKAARDAAKAAANASAADQLARKADIEKARADLEAARAKVVFSQADEKRVAALLNYTHMTAPYNGVVVVRNANTWDYVQPGTGDQSMANITPGQSSGRLPVYIVARTDLVRVYVDVPEMDANSVTKGTKARVRIQALGDEEMATTVTRTSWSLRPESRSLRAEIDLPNPDARLLPGMYAYGRVEIDRKNVRAVPFAAIVEIGNQNCCYVYENGKAVQMSVQMGINDGEWVEVAKKRVKGQWTAFTGDEEIILGDLTELSDGQSVVVDEGADGKK